MQRSYPAFRCAQPPMCCKPLHEDVIDAIAGQLRGGPGGGRRQDCPVLVALFFSNERRSSMTRLLAGILLIVLPTVMIGGVSILSLLIGDAYMENPLRRDLWRAGHAHAGVWLILALVALRYVDEANVSNVMKWLVRGSIPTLRSWFRRPSSWPCYRPMPRPRTGSSISPMLAQRCLPSVCSSLAWAWSGVRYNDLNLLRGNSLPAGQRRP